jgi:hypothetical protein
MKRYTIPLGRILGIPVALDPSWFLMFALVTWMLAASYFPNEFRSWSGSRRDAPGLEVVYVPFGR